MISARVRAPVAFALDAAKLLPLAGGARSRLGNRRRFRALALIFFPVGLDLLLAVLALACIALGRFLPLPLDFVVPARRFELVPGHRLASQALALLLILE